jgi:hypothetical protein
LPPKPGLALARRIVKEYNNDGFIAVIVEGDERIGKSTYVLKSLNQALDYLKGKKVNKSNWQTYLGWNPAEVIDTWAHKPSNIKYIGYIWDDAGVWLNNLQWSDPLLIEVQKYMSIVGSDYAFLGLTTPNAKWILNKINRIPGMMRIIIKKTMGSNRIGKLPESIRWAREARGYIPWFSPDTKRSGVRKILVDDFKCKMDNETYEWYKPLRDGYNDLIKLRMAHEALAQVKAQRLRDLQLETKGLRWQNQLRKLEKVKRKFDEENEKLPKDVSADYPNEIEDQLIRADIEDIDITSESHHVGEDGVITIDNDDNEIDLEGVEDE